MNPVEIEMNFPAEHGGNVFGQFDAYMKKWQITGRRDSKRHQTQVNRCDATGKETKGYVLVKF